MSSVPTKRARSAAWRLAAPVTLAFAVGSAVALLLTFHLVGLAVHGETDAVLSGEVVGLLDEVNETSAADLPTVLAGEQDELSRFQGRRERRVKDSLFLLVSRADGQPLAWKGTDDPRTLLRALQRAQLKPGAARGLRIPGFATSLRVAMAHAKEGRSVYIGLVDLRAEGLLRRIARDLWGLWLGMLAIGVGLAWASVRRVLARVDRVTRIAAEISDPEAGRRIPEDGRRDEIGRLILTINGMLDRVENAVHQLRTISGSVAHDLRSPITAVRNALETALTSKGEPAWDELVATAIERLDRLIVTLDSALDVAEAAGGALVLHQSSIDLVALVRDLAELYEPAAEERGASISLILPASASVALDPDLVRRALANLLDNALIHGGGRVAITVEEEPEAVTLTVADEGPGIASELAERVFEPGVRGSGSPGYGLGLPLVRAVARAHGGEARLVASSGGGAAVSLALPRRPFPPPAG